jgi:gliding motility-associated-like protein
MRKYSISTLFFTLILFQYGVAQKSFHRLYPTGNDGKEVQCISSTQLSNGDYLALSLLIEPVVNNQKKPDTTLLITSFKPKGDVNWTRSIIPDTSYGGMVIGSLGSIIQGDKDSIFFSFTTSRAGKPSKVIGAMDGNGKDAWLRVYTTDENKNDGSSFSHLVASYNRTLFSVHSGGKTTETELALSRKNYKGDIIWSKLLAARDASGKNITERPSHLSFSKDSTVLIAGVIDTSNVSSFIAVADTLGKILWSRSYKTPNATTIGRLNATSAARLNDSTYVLAGILSRTGGNNRGFVLKTTKNGQIEWNKIIRFKDPDITNIKYLTIDKNNDILISGTNEEVAAKITYPFAMKLSRSGSVIWKKKYTKVNAGNDLNGRMFSTDDGSVIFSTVIDDNKRLPSLIKLDSDGSTTCEDNIAEQILFDQPYQADTLIWTSTNGGIASPITYRVGSYSFNVPVVRLNNKTFCPKEPIVWTFKASVNGAVFYKWSREKDGKWLPLGEGATLDTFRVFEEGKYAVAVTMGEKVCYMLCDTTTLTRYEKPKVELDPPLLGNFCTNNKQTLIEKYTGGHPEIKSIVWSTGETNVTSIEIAQKGNYSITVTDKCDEPATAAISVGEFPKKITTATITPNVATDCLQGVTGTLTATGNSIGLGAESFKWSTQATSAAISINDGGVKTYTVTVSDACGISATTSYTTSLSGPGITEASIVVDKSTLCSSKKLTLIAQADKQGRFDYKWSTSDKDTFAILSTIKPGTYTVTITDKCKNSASASKSVGESDLTPDNLRYANVFFPEGIGFNFTTGTDSLSYDALKLNRTFGPVNKPEFCFDQITNYQFYVFNRWGQEVFKSTSIKDEWDGKINGSDSPADTYVWVVKYNIFGFEKRLKGDVTLLRP